MPIPRRSSNYTPITREMVEQLQAHVARTTCGAAKLLRGAKDKPAGLHAATIAQWLTGKVKSARPGYYDYVLTRWAALPDQVRIPLSAEMIATLTSEMRRTGEGAVTILRKTKDCPPNLNWSVILAWTRGAVETVDRQLWEYLFATLERLPTASSPSSSHSVRRQGREPIAESDLAELRRHRDRTSFGGSILLRNATDMPDNLTSGMVSGWLSGNTKTARPDHIAYVLARYREWP